MTPEGKVKKMIKEHLEQFGEDVYQHWPVLNGMGSPELDCNLIVDGRDVSIEAKEPGKHMTPRQQLTAAAKRRAGGLVFEVDSEFDMAFAVRAIKHILAHHPMKAWDEEQLNIENKNV
jgi:hypothetical protein